MTFCEMYIGWIVSGSEYHVKQFLCRECSNDALKCCLARTHTVFWNRAIDLL